jgi:4-hydroxybenzoate polyprenyltransferase
LRIFYFCITTNIFISLAAVALTFSTQVQLGMRPQFHPYLFLIFFATLFDYNLHRFVTVLTNKEALNAPRHRWVKEHLVIFYIVMAASVIGFLWAVSLAEKKVLITLIPIGMLTVFYSVPIFKNKKNMLRLREIPGLKIFLISFVWAASTILLPVIQSSHTSNIINIISMLAERFLFIFAITIPFDIRDMQADAKHKLKTIPLLIGKKNAIAVANIALLLFMAMCILHYNTLRLIWLNCALLLSAISTMFFINNKKLQANGYYHYGILDGTMLLQGLAVLAAYYIHLLF